MYQSGADHGTSCCGVVAAEIDGALTVGAAPGCKLLPVKWESSGPSLMISDSKMMTVLTFISDKADVLSNSWGSSPEFLFASNVINKITQLAQTGGRRESIVFLWAAVMKIVLSSTRVRSIFHLITATINLAVG
jgi:subtilisin family serine protease